MKFWAKAVYRANYLLNWVPMKAVSLVIPIEKWCGKNPSIDHLRTFVCVAWDHIPDDYRHKLDARSHACIMMGYYEESKAY